MAADWDVPGWFKVGIDLMALGFAAFSGAIAQALRTSTAMNAMERRLAEKMDVNQTAALAHSDRLHAQNRIDHANLTGRVGELEKTSANLSGKLEAFMRGDHNGRP